MPKIVATDCGSWAGDLTLPPCEVIWTPMWPSRASDPLLRAAQWFARTLRKPFTIHDTTIKPGQRIITLLASANRDEREYTDPDEFIWNRPIERLLAFGRGQHFCLGVHLARLEIAIMVTEWLKRVPDWRVVSESASRPPSSFQWGWNNIPVEV